MVNCSVCLADRCKDDFSATQLNRRAALRKCRQCLDPVVHDHIGVMYKWLRQHGAVLQNVQVKEMGPEFRTVFINNRVGKNELLISIPRSCIMTTSDAKRSAIGKELEKTNLTVHNHTWLALYLLEEKKKQSSFFAPYIDLLPAEYRNVPLMYSIDELKELDGTFALDMVVSVRQCLQVEFQNIKRSIPSLSISVDEFIWARIAVISRIFSMPAIQEEGLVPLADMLNHKQSATTTWRYCDTRAAFLIISTHVQLTGLEVFDSYGPKCNSRYFVNYGFTLANNEAYNQAALFVHPGALSALQAAIIGNPCSYDDGFSYYQAAIEMQMEQKVRCGGYFRFQIQCPGLNLPDCNPEETRKLDGLRCTLACLRLLRVLVATETEQELIASLCGKYMVTYPTGCKFLLSSFDLPPISAQNEINALHKLETLARERLAEFPTSYNDDHQSLLNAPLFSNKYNTLMIRCSEKKVLTDTAELCKAVTSAWSVKKSIFSVAKQLKQSQLAGNYIKSHWNKLKSYSL